jgi:ribosomal protein S20
MGKIKINSSETKNAISVFASAIESYRTASNNFASVAGNIDGMNSDFCNQMKSVVAEIEKTANKDIIAALEGYRDKVQSLVDGFEEVDEALSKSIGS